MSILISITLFQVLLLIFILFFSLWFLSFRISRKRLYELADKLPKIPNTLPLIGNAHQFSGKTEDNMKIFNWITEKALEQDGLVSVWLGPALYITMLNPRDIEIILNNCLKKDASYRFMKPWLGNGLVSGSFPIWKHHRKTLTPTFNQKILDCFLDVFNQQSKKIVQKLKNEVGKARFDAFQYVSPCTLDIICETAMGVTVNAQDSNDLPFIIASKRQMDIVCNRMFKIWLRSDIIFQLTQYSQIQNENLKILKEFTKEVVEKKKLEYQKSKNDSLEFADYSDDRPNVKRKAFLDLMIELSENGGHWSDDELREEVDTMTIAGNDTSAIVASFTLVMLGAHPEVQDKVMEEIYSIFGNSERDVQKDDLPKMQYLERVIKETLRLFPIAPIIVRTTEKETQLEKYLIPANVGCIVDVYGLHHRKDIWGEDVEEFKPDRFLPECQSGRHPYAYIPFSAGPRNCIGKQYAMMSLKVLLTTVLRSYRISADSDIKSIPLKVEVLLRPIGGHKISINYREKKNKIVMCK